MLTLVLAIALLFQHEVWDQGAYPGPSISPIHVVAVPDHTIAAVGDTIVVTVTITSQTPTLAMLMQTPDPALTLTKWEAATGAFLKGAPASWLGDMDSSATIVLTYRVTGSVPIDARGYQLVYYAFDGDGNADTTILYIPPARPYRIAIPIATT